LADVKKSATPMIPSSAKLLTALSIADMKSGITIVSQGTKTTVGDQIAVEQIKNTWNVSASYVYGTQLKQSW
jgi:hypothetical protein